jgi:hypothetical protein
MSWAEDAAAFWQSRIETLRNEVNRYAKENRPFMVELCWISIAVYEKEKSRVSEL